MGLLSSLMGNASEVDMEELQETLEAVIYEGEEVKAGYKVFRDLFVFTSKRLILIDRQGLTGKKSEYLTIPYKSISKFSVETAGTFDADAELKIWVGSDPTPLSKELKGGVDIVGLQKSLAACMFS